VTALHASLDQAIAEREYVKTIINTIIEPLVVLDEDLRIQTANQAFYTLFGVSRKPDLSLSEVFDLPDGQWESSPVHAFLTATGPDDGSTEALDVLHTIPSLGERALLLKARRIFQRRVGRVTVLAVQDVTDLKAAEEVIRETMAVKDQFLSLVSHELRTPIATIFGNGLLLLNRADRLAEEDKKQALVDIVEESRRLQRIIENLLVLTRIDAGRELDAEPINLQRLIEDAVAQFARRSGRSISLTLDCEVAIALGEPGLIQEVVTNLLSNAQKYSNPETLIEVVLGITADGQPRVSVLDRGIGFASEEESAAVKVTTGMGLGLAVCKKIVESYGGTIQANQRDGGGSEFWFSLPPAE
jgi:signal transduction histidine kinase